MADVIMGPQSEYLLVWTARRTATDGDGDDATLSQFSGDGASVPSQGLIGTVIHFRVVFETLLLLRNLEREEFFLELELVAMAMASLIAMAPSSLCCSVSSFFTPTPVPSPAAPKSSSASASVSRFPAIVCGRGDRRTAKGKRARGSFGNCRPKDSTKGTGLAITPLPPRPKRDDSADTEYIHVDIDETLFN